jgi:hypothetical protein
VLSKLDLLIVGGRYDLSTTLVDRTERTVTGMYQRALSLLPAFSRVRPLAGSKG